MAKRKSGNGPATITDMMRQAQGMFSLNPALGPQVTHFWEAQDAMLQEAEAFSRNWFERRHEAARAALETAREVSGNGASDPSAAMKAMTDWQTRTMRHMAEDVQEWIELCSNCAGHMARGEMEANKESIEETAKRSAKATQQHSTPV